MSAEICSFILRMGSTVVLARLLMPEHFGLISMVTALTVIAERFKDLGLDIATIQREKITHEQVSTLFWINASIGTLIMLIVALLSPVISWFYGDPRLVWISLALSSSFFFGGLTIQHQALLRRQMRFVHLAWVQILSIALSIAISVVLAWQGFGYWALVCKEIARPVFIMIGIWIMCKWLPSLPTRSAGISSMLRSGRDVTGFNIVYFLSSNLDKILIGKVGGAGPLGLYRQAYQLLLLPLSQLQYPLNYVSLPALSALQGETEKYRQYYKKIISILSFTTMPLVIYLGIFSESVIILILGNKWIEAAVIFKILAIGAFIQPVVSTCGIVMVTCNKTKRYFWWGVMNAIFMITAFCVGIHWGTIGVASAYSIANYAILLMSLSYCFRDTPISPSVFVKAISAPVLCSLIMGVILILITHKFALLRSLAGIPISLPVAIAIYIGAWVLLPEGKQKLFEYLSYPFVAFKHALN